MFHSNEKKPCSARNRADRVEQVDLRVDACRPYINLQSCCYLYCYCNFYFSQADFDDRFNGYCCDVCLLLRYYLTPLHAA
jgi:hypothetical protein